MEIAQAQTNITISGRIISELSEKLPSYLIAMNELIKNSYDAGASNVKIILKSDINSIVIQDDGIGMDKEDIERLLHISNSEKQYGVLTEVNSYIRRIQGSKGLGFLSVFKLGDNVTWTTIKNQRFQFSINYKDLTEAYNVSDYDIILYDTEIDEFDESAKAGTKINICSKLEAFSALKSDLSNETIRNKLLNSFIFYNVVSNTIEPDQGFLIELYIDDEYYSTNHSLKLDSELPENHSIRIKYEPNTQLVKFYFKETFLCQKEFNYDSSKYKLYVDIQSYKFRSGQRQNINPLFYKLSNNELTPILYVNNNIFNNYDIFDTDIMRSIRTGSILPQMTGYISILSSDTQIDFNSDRTQFIETTLTREIIKTIKELNIIIQTTGSKLKKEINGGDIFTIRTNKINEAEISEHFDPRELLRRDVLIRDRISIEKSDTTIDYSFVGVFNQPMTINITPKTKEIFTEQYEFYVSEDPCYYIPDIQKRIEDATYISLNSESISEIDWEIPGELEIIQEDEGNKKVIKITILELRKPEVLQLNNIVELNQIYSLDNLFVMYNSYGVENSRIKPEIDTHNQQDIIINMGSGTIKFGRISSNKKITFKVTDKDTGLFSESEFYFVVQESKNRIITKFSQSDYISLPISKGENLPHEILSFIEELNSLEKDDDYSYTFVSSVRTLVELCVLYLLDAVRIDKNENLSENYKKVLSNSPNIIEKFTDPKDKQIMNSFHKVMSSPDERIGYIAFLNLSTHGSTKMISKGEASNKVKELKFLLELLNKVLE